MRIKSHLRRARVALATLTLAVSFGLTTIPSHAGSNGQQLVYTISCRGNWEETWGYNQNGQYTDHWVYAPYTQNNCVNNPNQYYEGGWWWVGGIYNSGWWDYDGNQGSGPLGTSADTVPQSQSSDWWYTGTPN